MRAATLRAWPRFGALLRLLEKLNWKHEEKGVQEEDLNDHVRRDLGLMDGRDRIGPGHARQSDELREALRLPPRML